MGKDLQKSLALTAAAGLVAGIAGCSNGKKPAKDPSESGEGVEPEAASDTEEADVTDEAAGDKDCCAPGKNPCKGKGACATETHDCAGKNECKGKGGCTPKDCK